MGHWSRKIVAMRVLTRMILIFSIVLVALLVVGLRTGRIPTGIRGEWEWLRLGEKVHLHWASMALGASGVAVYSVMAGLGYRSLRQAATTTREALWLAGLLVAAIAVQVAIPIGAPYGYGLTRWALVNYLPGSSGYFRIARDRAAPDPIRFLAEYPVWIESQDSLHIGTHPPGLILAECLLLSTMERHPGLAESLTDWMPEPVQTGFRSLSPPPRRHERAALFVTALITLVACAGTVVPLYLLARSSMPAHAAWAAAALWPVASAANLFQPDADTAYPLLSTAAWALAAWSARWTGRRSAFVLAAASGIVMGLGMAFTLALLPVGLIVALIVATDSSVRPVRRIGLIAATGVGFLAVVLGGWIASGANPFVIWSWNLHHHARFYDEYPRTYRVWLWANGIELAIAIGLPTAVWAMVGMVSPRSLPRPAWATLAVLFLVNLTGRNMGEVARLWLLFMPPITIAAAKGLDRLGVGPIPVAITTATIGAQTLALQAMIQVVYPV